MSQGPHLPPDDLRLSAWLDGELPEAEARAIQQWLAAHPEDAARARLWAADREALRARADALLADPVPDHLCQLVLRGGPRPGVATLPARARWQQPWAQGALAAGLLAAGVLLGQAWQRLAPGPAPVDPQAAQRAAAAAARLASEGPLPDWVGRAAAAHAVYVPERRHPVEVSVQEGDAAQRRAQEEHLVKWLTKRIALPVKLFDLSSQGFALVGGRLLPDGARQSSAQLMYEDSTGTRITIYMRKPDDAQAVSFRFQSQGDIGSWYWVEDGYGCALVGRLPRERLLALAELMYKQYEEQAHSAAAASTPRR